MNHTEIFKEAKRLHSLGLAIHWLHKRSKRPIESGWTTGPRKDWEYLKTTYIEGLNVGVRLGSPSKIGNGYLAVIDVDIKSADDRHRNEALSAAKRLLAGAAVPSVSSGRGGGSRHYYCLTEKPFKTFNPAQSTEIVKVKMPSKKPSKKEIETLTGNEIAEGWRLSHAWEISLYSDGRQVVLPPSIHPDTGATYTWKKHLTNVNDLPLIEFEIPTEEEKKESGQNSPATTRNILGDRDSSFTCKFVHVDLALCELPDKILKGITTGEGVEDRSGYLLRAASVLQSRGLERDEILSVLTDPANYISACAYEHAKTKDRTRAARWVWRYTLKDVVESRSPLGKFSDVRGAVQREGLSEAEVEAQTKEIEDGIKWFDRLERTDIRSGNKVKNTLFNIKLILSEVFGKDAVKTNEFANTEEMWGEFPWTNRPGKEIYDIDVKMLRNWFMQRWDFEASEDKIITVLSVLGFEARYHPVKQWLGALPKWDEKSRIDSLLDLYIPCEGSDELRAVVGRRFMVALIKRIYEPGCQSDYLLILEGLQGLSKSTAFRTLIGDDWFSDASFNVNDKDAVMVIFSKWLIEFGELSTLDRTTAEATKAFITRRVDRMRAPFDKKARDYPRQCLFVGSTNKNEYLKDDSGNRRYWPFRVTSECRLDLIKADREQLFAEALYYYQIGELTYLAEPHLKDLMAVQQEAKEMHDVLSEQVEDAIGAHNEDSKEALNHFQISKIFEMGQLSGVKNDHYGTARVATALRKLGYEGYREGGGSRRRLWRKVGESKLVRSTQNARMDVVDELTENEDFDFR